VVSSSCEQGITDGDLLPVVGHMCLDLCNCNPWQAEAFFFSRPVWCGDSGVHVFCSMILRTDIS
jgi:hypothetical protein